MNPFENQPSTSTSHQQVYEEEPPPYYQEPETHPNRPNDTDRNRRRSVRKSKGFQEFAVSGKGLSSFATLSEDGRITVDLDLKRALPELPEEYSTDVKEFAIDDIAHPNVPPLNIVVMIVGSRGDVQPYVALGHSLAKYGHRVRIATHETFRSFVLDAGLDFYPIGGDPKELLSYMVKNPGLLPGFDSLTNGDIGRKRKMLAEMFQGCWRASIDPGTGYYDHFVADAIISNPPAFAHIHIAEALGVPLLLSFTMPWSPTKAFPHPLVNINQSNAQPGLTNYLTYGLADLMTWEGLSDVINKFRTRTLNIPALSIRTGPGLVDRLKVPWTYCLSPALIPKPRDWKNHIDVVGFYFLKEQGYQPDPELEAFLNAGPPPVYIGFGSVVVEDAAAMTNIVFGAIENSGVRALVSVGWGGLGGVEVPSNVFMLGNVPHDWLFQRVAAVVHHGGAGTTAIGLKMGKPTTIVPFFGDQPFWGAMVHKAGAGPEPIPHRNLNVANLTAAIEFCMSPGARTAAEAMGEIIRSEDGVKEGVDSFHRHLPLLNMRCDLDPHGRVAVWYWNDEFLKLSAFAAQVLIDAGKLRLSDLVLHRSKEYNSTKAARDPVAGGAVDVLDAVTNSDEAVSNIFFMPVKGLVVTTLALPKGAFDIISGIQSGFATLPKRYGSSVREPGEIKNFADGMKEAGKGFYYGFHDGFKGLVTTPIEGAKKEGFVGALKGSAKSLVDVAMKPVAGGLGLAAYPAQGAEASIRKLLKMEKGKGKGKGKEVQREWLTSLDVITEARRKDGVEGVRSSTPTDRAAVLKAYEEASRGKNKRRTILGEQAMQALHDGTANIPDSSGMESPFDESKSPSSSLAPSRASSSSSSSLSLVLPYTTIRSVPPPLPSQPGRSSPLNSTHRGNLEYEDSVYAPSLPDRASSSYFDNSTHKGDRGINNAFTPPHPDRSNSDNSTHKGNPEINNAFTPPHPDRSNSMQKGDPDEDEAFVREMEFAIQLSLAEQRGYERGRLEAWGPQ